MLRGAAAGLSALLLWTGFREAPGSGSAAWVALVPLLWLIDDLDGPREAFRWGWGCGFGAWLLSLAWLWRLIPNGGPAALVCLGHLLLAAYCALYTGLFAAAVQRLGRPAGIVGRGVTALIAIPLLWVGSEYLRATLFTGFAWNHLGVSQFRNPPLIQSAEWGGVYAVSALIVMVNTGVAAWLRHWVRPANGRFRLRGLPCELFCALLILMGAWMWGRGRMRAVDARMASEGYTAHVAALQPNAPSIFAWSEASLEEARRFLRRKTELAAISRPDLIVWPETSVMGSLPDDREVMRLVSGAAAQAGIPLLVGTIEVEWDAEGGRASEPRLYNASWLFGPDGVPRDRYRKQHLVPFGEYIPLDKRWPFLVRFSPIGYSCHPGREAGILRIPLSEHPGTRLVFSPLICFEDTVAALSRRAVRAGARLLINQTNDAWFEGSEEPFQHMAQSVFRAVENRTPLFRCANSGVTALIDAAGRSRALRDADDRTHGFQGLFRVRVRVDDAGVERPTLYNRAGDGVLAAPAAGLLVLVLISGWAGRWRGDGFRLRSPFRTGSARRRRA